MGDWQPLPTPDGYEWVDKFMLSGPTGHLKAGDCITRIRSVDLHASGLWAIVDMGDTTAWIRIPPDVGSVEWQRQHDLVPAAPEVRPPTKLRAALLKAQTLMRTRR